MTIRTWISLTLVIFISAACARAIGPTISTIGPTNEFYGFLQAGRHHEMKISMGGAANSSVSYTVLRNDFILSSPNGAHWDNLIITPLISAGDTGFPYTTYSIGLKSGGNVPNGMGADTIELTADVPPGNCFTGMQSRTTFSFFKLSFDSRVADSGRTIVFGRPATIDPGSWQWTEDSLCGGTITIPAFPAITYPLTTKDCFLRGDVNTDGSAIEIADLTDLVAYLFLPSLMVEIPLLSQADLDADGNIDISDLTKMVDAMFISFDPPVPCP